MVPVSVFRSFRLFPHVEVPFSHPFSMILRHFVEWEVCHLDPSNPSEATDLKCVLSSVTSAS